MITAVDSCVLVDILANDPLFAARSMSSLSQAKQDGQVIVSDIVVAEITPIIGDRVQDFLNSLEIHFIQSNLTVALLAGKTFQAFLKNGGKGGRIVPDFLVGHHALEFGDRLLTRDRGFQRNYFETLQIWYPEF